MSRNGDVEHYGDQVVRGQQRQIGEDDIIVRCAMSLALSPGDGFFLNQLEFPVLQWQYAWICGIRILNNPQFNPQLYIIGGLRNADYI